MPEIEDVGGTMSKTENQLRRMKRGETKTIGGVRVMKYSDVAGRYTLLDEESSSESASWMAALIDRRSLPKISGTVFEDDYGNIHFDFDDGTYAIVFWSPSGELGDGDGGEFDPTQVETNSKISVDALVSLAHINTGAPGPIKVASDA